MGIADTGTLRGIGVETVLMVVKDELVVLANSNWFAGVLGRLDGGVA